MGGCWADTQVRPYRVITIILFLSEYIYFIILINNILYITRAIYKVYLSEFTPPCWDGLSSAQSLSSLWTDKRGFHRVDVLTFDVLTFTGRLLVLTIKDHIRHFIMQGSLKALLGRPPRDIQQHEVCRPVVLWPLLQETYRHVTPEVSQRNLR